MPLLQPRLAGALMVAAAALCWSSGGAFVRLIEKADAWTQAFWRQAFMVATLLIVLAVMERGRVAAAFLAPGWRVLASGLCFAVMMTGYLLALAKTTVANTLLIMAAAPFLAALLAWALLAEKPALRLWVAMAVAFAGIGIMVAGDLGGGALVGNLLALSIAAAAAVNICVLRGSGAVNMIPAVILGGAISALVALPFASFAAPTAGDFVYLFLLGAVQLGLGCAIYVYGARHLSAAEATLLALLETVLSPVWAWLVVGEVPSNAALAGGALVLAAVLFVAHANARATPKAAPA
jgi:drug/metabolite transporter (DMT)-like permease